MLENDDVTGMPLPIEHWQKAEVAFGTHPCVSATTPSSSTLVSVLQYVKHRLFLAYVQRMNEKDGLVALSVVDKRNGCAVAWCERLCFLLESALQVLVTSLELEQHDRLQSTHLGTAAATAASGGVGVANAMHVRKCICLRICFCGSMYLRIYVSIYLCIYLSIYSCIYASMYLCI
jgi:hypothetical protein